MNKLHIDEEQFIAVITRLAEAMSQLVDFGNQLADLGDQLTNTLDELDTAMKAVTDIVEEAHQEKNERN